jgi:hypothetical protein
MITLTLFSDTGKIRRIQVFHCSINIIICPQAKNRSKYNFTGNGKSSFDIIWMLYFRQKTYCVKFICNHYEKLQQKNSFPPGGFVLFHLADSPEHNTSTQRRQSESQRFAVDGNCEGKLYL